MASLSKERSNQFRIHWRFKVRVGSRAGETIRGSQNLGRCTRTFAKQKLREIEEWEDAVAVAQNSMIKILHHWLYFGVVCKAELYKTSGW